MNFDNKLFFPLENFKEPKLPRMMIMKRIKADIELPVKEKKTKEERKISTFLHRIHILHRRDREI